MPRLDSGEQILRTAPALGAHAAWAPPEPILFVGGNLTLGPGGKRTNLAQLRLAHPRLLPIDFIPEPTDLLLQKLHRPVSFAHVHTYT